MPGMAVNMNGGMPMHNGQVAMNVNMGGQVHMSGHGGHGKKDSDKHKKKKSSDKHKKGGFTVGYGVGIPGMAVKVDSDGEVKMKGMGMKIKF